MDSERKVIVVHDLISGRFYEETYDKLVLSPGAVPIRPALEGVDAEGIFTLRNVEDTDKIKAYIDVHNVKRALIVGAGFIGLEMAENLHEYGIQVAVVEMANQVVNPVVTRIATVVQQCFKSKNIGLYLQEAVTAFQVGESGINVILKSGLVLQVDMVLLSIGVRPDVNGSEGGIRNWGKMVESSE